MGLDITAYQKAKLVKAVASPAELRTPGFKFPATAIYLHTIPDFAERCDGMPEGFYRMTGKQYGFRAGPYSYYNRWRHELAELVGTTARAIWDDPKPGPFVELINFADNEGFIGFKTSAKLAEDFRRFASKVGDNGDFAEGYRDWQRAFELASEGGVVHFH